MALSKLSSFIPTGMTLLVALVVVAIVLGMMYSNQVSELFTSKDADVPAPADADMADCQPRPARSAGSNEVFSEPEMPQKKPCDPNKPYSPEGSPAPCFPADQLTAKDLLPKDDDNEWAKNNPKGSGSLDKMNFLEAGYHYGINTVGQTLRNANLQLRSEVPNPQVQVSPFLQTTIEPDLSRRVLEIGSGSC